MATVEVLGTTVDAGSSSVYTSQTTVPDAGSFVLVFVLLTDCAEPAPTITVNGVPPAPTVQYDLVAKCELAGGSHTVYCYAADRAAIPIIHTIDVDCSPTVATGCIIEQLEMRGVRRYGASALRQLVTEDNNVGGVPETVFPAPCLIGNPTVSFFGANAANPAVIWPLGWILRRNNGIPSAPFAGCAWSSRNVGFVGDTITWRGSMGTKSYGMIAIEFDPSPAPVFRSTFRAQDGTPAAPSPLGDPDVKVFHQIPTWKGV